MELKDKMINVVRDLVIENEVMISVISIREYAKLSLQGYDFKKYDTTTTENAKISYIYGRNKNDYIGLSYIVVDELTTISEYTVDELKDLTYRIDTEISMAIHANRQQLIKTDPEVKRSFFNRFKLPKAMRIAISKDIN